MPEEQGGGEQTLHALGAKSVSPAGAEWGEPSPAVESQTDAEGHDLAIERAVLRAEEALARAFHSTLDN